MISEIRPSIHHLGDQLIWISSELAKGRKHFNVQLVEGLYDLIPDITWFDEVTRYNSAFELDFHCKLIRFDESKYVPCQIPTKPYITIQLDTSKDRMGDCIVKKVYSLDEDWKSWIINKYVNMGFDIVDVGGMRWSLAETAYIMKHSQGHVGTVSAFSIFSSCVGSKFTHQYYNTNMTDTMLIPNILISYKYIYSNNGIRSYFRDPNLDIELY